MAANKKYSEIFYRQLLRTAAVLILLVTTQFSCSFHAPQFKITGERTALETQILGTYNQVQEDVWMVASVRSSETDTDLIISAEKREVLQAVQNREFNRDDIVEFKEAGLVGENAQGLLEIRPTPKYNSDTRYQLFVDGIVTEENNDRETIIQRIVAVNPNLRSATDVEIRQAFARINQQDARSGEWLQATDGTWYRKSEKGASLK